MNVNNDRHELKACEMKMTKAYGKKQDAKDQLSSWYDIFLPNVADDIGPFWYGVSSKCSVNSCTSWKGRRNTT